MNGTPRIIADDCVLTYLVCAETWYANTLNDADSPDLYISATSNEGGQHWEFGVIDRTAVMGHPCLELRLFSDALAALADLPEFFAAMAAEQPRDLNAVRAILDRIGAVDGTVRERPWSSFLPLYASDSAKD